MDGIKLKGVTTPTWLNPSLGHTVPRRFATLCRGGRKTRIQSQSSDKSQYDPVVGDPLVTPYVSEWCHSSSADLSATTSVVQFWVTQPSIIATPCHPLVIVQSGNFVQGLTDSLPLKLPIVNVHCRPLRNSTPS